MRHLALLCLLFVICVVVDTNGETFSIFGDQAGRNQDYDDSSLENPDSKSRISEYSNSRRSWRKVRNAQKSNRSKRLDDPLTLVNYNNEEPPPTNGTGTPVRFTVLVFRVRGINEILQEVNVDMRLQIYWKDSRLDHWRDAVPEKSKYLGISLKKMSEIWFPDIFVDNIKEVSQPKLLSPPASLRYYYENREFRYSTRIALKMDCPMKFHYYPADFQQCPIDLKSYAYPDTVLSLDWVEEKDALVLLEKNLEAPNFELTLALKETIVIKTKSHNYSGIRFRVQLKRQLSYHLIQTYIPSTLFVFVSMLSFLVPPESVPGRMAICMTTLLTLTAMWSAVRGNIPKVSYIKALDIWMVACVFFVCLALVEYTVILNLRKRMEKPKPASLEDPMRKASRDTISSISAPIPGSGYPYNAMPIPQQRKASGEPNANSTPASKEETNDSGKIERAVKFLETWTWLFLVLLFLLFNLIYWPYLLVGSEYFVNRNSTHYYQ